MNFLAVRACSVSVLLITASGCSTMRDYPNSFPSNLSVRTTTRSGSVFTGIRTYLHLYRMKDACEVEYLGTVELKDTATGVGIESGQPTYLKFVFKRTETFGGAALIEYTTVITPRSGVRYAADVSYVDRTYDVKVRELDRNGAPVREFRRQGRDCPPAR